jgi:hypothetical protein
MRGYIRFATLPNVNCWISRFGSPEVGLAFRVSDSSLYCASGSNTDSLSFGATGYPITTGQWYRVDENYKGTATTTFDAMINDTPLGQVSGFTAIASSAGFVIIYNGAATITADMFVDDMVISQTAADYPIGHGYGHPFVYTADGTHNIAGTGDFQRGNTGTDILNATTTAWQLCDDVPLPSGTVDEADNQRAVAPPNATDYVECIFGPASGIPTPNRRPPQAVDVVLAHHQISNVTGSMRVALNDNGTVNDVLTITTLAGVVTYRYARKQYALAPTGGAWTLATGAGNFLNLRGRFFSADAAPDQCLDAIMIEADFPYYKPRPPLNLQQAVNRASTF